MSKWLFIAILLSGIGGAAYLFYKDTQGTIASLNKDITQLNINNETLENNVLTLKNTVEQSNETITFLEKSYDDIVVEFDAANAEFQIIRLTNQELRERLGRHELDALAAAKPDLVENIINKASKSAARCLELLSGSPLTESESDTSKTAMQKNSECPWLFE